MTLKGGEGVYGRVCGGGGRKGRGKVTIKTEFQKQTMTTSKACWAWGMCSQTPIAWST